MILEVHVSRALSLATTYRPPIYCKAESCQLHEFFTQTKWLTKILVHHTGSVNIVNPHLGGIEMLGCRRPEPYEGQEKSEGRKGVQQELCYTLQLVAVMHPARSTRQH